jgi:ATP-dependent Clp protease adaptor protein ClpS
MADSNTELHGEVLTEETVETKEPPRFKVLLHNDDYTTMEFVVSILENIFQKNQAGGYPHHVERSQ